MNNVDLKYHWNESAHFLLVTAQENALFLVTAEDKLELESEWLHKIVQESYQITRKRDGYVVPVIGLQHDNTLPEKMLQVDEILNIKENEKFPRLFCVHGRTLAIKEYPHALEKQSISSDLVFAWSSSFFVESEIPILKAQLE